MTRGVLSLGDGCSSSSSSSFSRGRFDQGYADECGARVGDVLLLVEAQQQSLLIRDPGLEEAPRGVGIQQGAQGVAEQELRAH